MMKGLIAAASTILLFAAALQAEAGALMRRNPPVFPNTVYLIPNAESFGSDNDGGLNAVGQERAKCLPSVSICKPVIKLAETHSNVGLC